MKLLPERESSCETNRTSFDFMNCRGFGPASFRTTRTASAALSLPSSKRLLLFALHESNALLIKKTIAVERENNAKTIKDHFFFFCIIHAFACFAMNTSYSVFDFISCEFRISDLQIPIKSGIFFSLEVS